MARSLDVRLSKLEQRGAPTIPPYAGSITVEEGCAPEETDRRIQEAREAGRLGPGLVVVNVFVAPRREASHGTQS